MKKQSYSSFRSEQLQDPDVKQAYQELEGEFALAREVLELRRQRNITQKELAAKMGTSQPAIARIESGNYRNVSLAFIRRLADALGAEPEIRLRKKEA
ncbi:MAG: helix-turn-helix domain-containing protein [Thermodesulfobacteriota bacterium]